VIGTNKADGDRVAELIQADFPQGGGKPGRAALDRLLAASRVRHVSFEDWERINAVEEAAAPPGAPRRQLTRVADLLTVLDGNDDGDPITGV
jgi:ferredoxin--NADP+ reductase